MATWRGLVRYAAFTRQPLRGEGGNRYNGGVTRFVMLACAYWTLLAQPTLCMADLLACPCQCEAESHADQEGTCDKSECHLHCCTRAIVSAPETRPRGDGHAGWTLAPDSLTVVLPDECPVLMPDGLGRPHTPPFRADLPFPESDIPLLV